MYLYKKIVKLLSNFLFSILFADDTTVLIESQNYNNIVFTLNTELQKLDVWLQANKLTLNTAKHTIWSFIKRE